jgi:ankyrin repeat protein
MNLIEAVESGNLEEVKRLLSEGADVHENDDQAIIVACSYCYLEVIKLLVAHGADIHTKKNFVFKSAKFNGHAEVVDYLNKQLLIKKINVFI